MHAVSFTQFEQLVISIPFPVIEFHKHEKSQLAVIVYEAQSYCARDNSAIGDVTDFPIAQNWSVH